MNTSRRNPQELELIAQASGLVNAHTHLELSDLRAPIGQAGTPITEWIPPLLKYRQTRTPEDLQRAVVLGLKESAEAGTSTIADIVQDDPPLELADELGVRLIAFREMIGFSPERTIEARQAAARFLRRFEHLRENETPPREGEAPAEPKSSSASGSPGGSPSQAPSKQNHRVGLSPHAPYTICRDLLEAAVSLSARKEVPLAIHLAETREELQLLSEREGPFRKFLDTVEGWSPDAALLGRRPLDYLEAMDQASQLVVIHGNYLDEEELDWLAERADRATVVYCPRSHAYFGHDPYPLLKMLDRGVRVAIGTDSRASSPDLSIRAELCLVAEQFPDLPIETVLELGTRPLFV